MTPVKIQDHKYHDVTVNLQELNKLRKLQCLYFTPHIAHKAIVRAWVLRQ